MVSEISKSGHFNSLKQQCLIILIFFLAHHDSNQETCMNIAQETVTYLEFQTRKRNGGKRTTYHRYISDWSTLPNFLRKPMPCKIFKWDLKKFVRAKIL